MLHSTYVRHNVCMNDRTTSRLLKVESLLQSPAITSTSAKYAQHETVWRACRKLFACCAPHCVGVVVSPQVPVAYALLVRYQNTARSWPD